VAAVAHITPQVVRLERVVVVLVVEAEIVM